MIFIIAVTYTFNEHRIYLFIYESIFLAVCVYFIPQSLKGPRII